MPLSAMFAQKLRAVARFLTKPELVPLRLKGVDLNTYEKLAARWVRDQNIATILDIGASDGHFALAAHRAFPEARIVSFEPLPDCFEQLQKRMTGVANFTAVNLALGEESGKVSFNRSAAYASSSCLTMASAHKSAFPHSQSGETISVPMDSLDNVARRMDLNDPMLIKIDVQGYEDRVLRGGEQTVKRAKIVITETSFETMYEGQLLFADIHSLFVRWGFRYAGIFDQICDPKSDKPLQCDSIFLRS